MAIQKQGFSDIRDLINSGFSEFREHNYYRADSLSEDEVGKLYDNRILNLEKWLNSDEAKDQFSEKEKAFLVSQYQKLETPFIMNMQAVLLLLWTMHPQSLC